MTVINAVYTAIPCLYRDVNAYEPLLEFMENSKDPDILRMAFNIRKRFRLKSQIISLRASLFRIMYHLALKDFVKRA